MIDGRGFEGREARTYSSTNCSHVDQVHLVVEVCQSSVDIIDFKPAINWYIVLVHDCRSQVCTDDFNMRVPAGCGHSPGTKMKIELKLLGGDACQIPLPHPESGRAKMNEAYEV